MSGIEIVGLILGAIPILLPALDAYKNGLSRTAVFVRRRRHVEELIRALGVNRLLLDQHVRLLLTKVGVEDIPNDSMNFSVCLMRTIKSTKTSKPSWARKRIN